MIRRHNLKCTGMVMYQDEVHLVDRCGMATHLLTPQMRDWDVSKLSPNLDNFVPYQML